MQETDSTLAPIVLFAYKRPEELRQALEALKANHLASQSDLFVFVDGPKKEADKPRVKAVRQLVDDLTGFRSVTRYYSEVNRGLATSVISGVTQIIERYNRVIVLEDDLLTSPNFLDFMNQALQNYREEKKVFSITGYTFPFERPADYKHDVYFYPRTGSWGWATWKDRWLTADWLVSDYEEFMANKARKEQFNVGGSDRVRMLRRWKNKEIDSWAIRWCYAQDRAGGLTVYPTISKIENIGFSRHSTNTVVNRFQTTLDDGLLQEFTMPEKVHLSKYYLRCLQWKFSLPLRIVNRIRSAAPELIYNLRR